MDRMIDPHCHCRDGRQAYKATIGEVMRKARKLGIVAVCDMPNKKTAVKYEHQVDHYVSLAEGQGFPEGYYLYIGGTPEREQIQEAARVATFHPKVLGIKVFGADGGELTISEGHRYGFFEALAEEEYAGIVAAHCEDKRYFRPDLWDPSRPWMWNDVRPGEAETSSAEDFIKAARKAGFGGTLYILHVTAPETLDLIDYYRGDLKIVCGATPHHLLRTAEDMKGGRLGLRLKVNPPVRDACSMEGLRKRLREGKIDLIESDHAPHSFDEKFVRDYLSGFTSYDIYPELLEEMPKWGLSQEQIDNLTYYNAKRIFKKIKE